MIKEFTNMNRWPCQSCTMIKQLYCFLCAVVWRETTADRSPWPAT